MPSKNPRANQYRPFQINYGDTVTMGSHLVDLHYLKMGIAKLWTPKRLERLCRFLKLTEYELASLIMVHHKDMKIFLEKGRFPPIVSWSLSLVELCLMPEKMTDSVSFAGDGNFMPYNMLHEKSEDS